MSETLIEEETTEKTEKNSRPVELKGDIQSWNLGADDASGRRYITVLSNFGMLRRAMRPDLFSSSNGSGEQRAQKRAHVRKLRGAILNNQFTPTAVYAGVRDYHNVRYEGKKKVFITVNEEQPLPLTDGGHRWLALEEIRKESPTLRRKIDNLPITALVMLDSQRTAQDFLNLQEGCPVDKNHLLSLRIHNNMLDQKKNPIYMLGNEICHLLHECEASPIHKMVKFDSLGSAPIKFSSLMTSNASQLAVSVYGSALIAQNYEKDAEWMASTVVLAFEAIQEINDGALLKSGKVLCPPPEGNNGGASLIIGLANMLAYRLKLTNRETPSPKDYEVFKRCVEEVFDDDAHGNLSRHAMSEKMGEFADLFFADLANREDSPIATHDGIPISLLVLLKVSSFNASPLPKANAGKRGRKPKNLTLQEWNDLQTKKDENSETEELMPDGGSIEGPDSVTEDSDTDPEFLEESPW